MPEADLCLGLLEAISQGRTKQNEREPFQWKLVGKYIKILYAIKFIYFLPFENMTRLVCASRQSYHFEIYNILSKQSFIYNAITILWLKYIY